jgi:hypothetical protein
MSERSADIRSHAVRAMVLCGTALALGCSADAQTPHFLGPDAIRTVKLDSLRVLHRIGDADGPGMLEQGVALVMEPHPGGGFLIFTHYMTDGSLQHWRDGNLVRTFGRQGSGPGEYSMPGAMAIDPRTGVVWVHDHGGNRLVSFTSAGAPGRTVPLHEIGLWFRDLKVLPDGSLVINGAGGATSANFGYLIHRYDFDRGSWSSYHPALVDSTFTSLDEIWRRKLDVTSAGKLIAVSYEYEIEVFDPEAGFALETTVRRQPQGWPLDAAAENARLRNEEDPMAPGFYLLDSYIDGRDRLWIITSMPDENWKDAIVPNPSVPSRPRKYISPDSAMDTLLEVFDLSTMAIVASHRLDPELRYIVGPGMFAHYAGDLPYPRFEILEIDLNKEDP